MPKDGSRKQLAVDQGYICAYCMRRVCLDSENKEQYINIEHIVPQNQLTSEEATNFSNFIGVCPGGRDQSDNTRKTCDAYRGILSEEQQTMQLNPLNEAQMKTIIRNMTRDATISEIILEKSADIKKEKAFIVLEGYDDIRCLKKIVTQNVVMILSFSGKDGVKEIVQHFGSDRVIGICDRDYEAVANTQEIFYYDFCCLEMMLISADAAFEAICSEYYNNAEDVLSMREAILRKLFILSNIRKANAEQKLGINFKGVSVSDVANMDDTTAYSELIRRIKRVNPQKACEIEICTNSMQETDP